MPAATREQAFLTSLLEGTGAQRTVLTDADASRTTILDSLATHTWAHVSCHGDQDLANPTAGGLVPHDWNTAGLVSVLDLTAADHVGGEFVFLSACMTATGGVTNLDESISLAAALHHAGWRHVIGTLWSVADFDAEDITRATYLRLIRDNLDPAHAAEALHHALRDYRARLDNRDRPSRWAFFLHIGP